MAYKFREEIVGKRFLSVSGFSKLKVNKISEWGWRAGVIRAASHRDNLCQDLQVSLLENIENFYILYSICYKPIVPPEQLLGRGFVAFSFLGLKNEERQRRYGFLDVPCAIQVKVNNLGGHYTYGHV